VFFSTTSAVDRIARLFAGDAVSEPAYVGRMPGRRGRWRPQPP